LYACDTIEIGYGRSAFFNTGIAVEFPVGYEGQVRGRSSLAKKGFVTCGGVGTCDSDYRGSIGVALMWAGQPGSEGKTPATETVIAAGDRIAQLVIVPVPRIALEEVAYEDLKQTARGSGGFGSSGR
jgi:dUTP pyrophosphatase